MLPATIAICRKLCSLQAKQKRCSNLNAECVIKIEIKSAAGIRRALLLFGYFLSFVRLCDGGIMILRRRFFTVLFRG